MSDIQVIPVRIKILGPQFWQCIVEDAETGRRLPVQISDQAAFTVRVEDGFWVADVTLLVDEVEAEVPARAKMVGDPLLPIQEPAESVDDFAARTVSLIMEPK